MHGDAFGSDGHSRSDVSAVRGAEVSRATLRRKRVKAAGQEQWPKSCSILGREWPGNEDGLVSVRMCQAPVASSLLEAETAKSVIQRWIME